MPEGIVPSGGKGLSGPERNAFQRGGSLDDPRMLFQAKAWPILPVAKGGEKGFSLRSHTIMD